LDDLQIFDGRIAGAVFCSTVFTIVCRLANNGFRFQITDSLAFLVDLGEPQPGWIVALLKMV
jgi:hypothetical protein